MNILSLTCEAFADACKTRHGVARVSAIALYRAVMGSGQRRLADDAALAKSPALGAQLEKGLKKAAGRIVERQEDGGVLKFATAFEDGASIESVVIPDRGRSTLCVSSQVGCRMGCKFCVTGEMGLRRHLTVEEIVGQVVAARYEVGRPVDNVVFMGMGEPLDNLAAVIPALRVLADSRGLNIPYRRITVSTAGHVDGLRELAAAQLPNLRLAISIHAANEALRTRLVPLNARYSLEQLKVALREYPLGRGGVFLIEYVLLAGVNDQQEHASELVRYLDGLPVRVNVIPYNGGSRRPFVSPSREEIDRFCGWLTGAGLFVRRRHPKGRDVMAACGQLGAVRGA